MENFSPKSSSDLFQASEHRGFGDQEFQRGASMYSATDGGEGGDGDAGGQETPFTTRMEGGRMVSYWGGNQVVLQ